METDRVIPWSMAAGPSRAVELGPLARCKPYHYRHTEVGGDTRLYPAGGTRLGASPTTGSMETILPGAKSGASGAHPDDGLLRPVLGLLAAALARTTPPQSAPRE
jgi:hypothetical protein